MINDAIKFKKSIILFINELISVKSDYKLKYYLEFYQNIFSDIHFYKITRSLVGWRKNILEQDKKFINVDPIFTIIKLDGVYPDIWYKYSNELLWLYYKFLTEICYNYCLKNIFPKLSYDGGFVIKLDKLDSIINDKR